jgi:hypothetical protein
MIQNSFDFSKLTNIVVTENGLWGNQSVSETGAEAIPMLKKYWENVGEKFEPTSDYWTTKAAWSAVYISWVITQVDGTFPKKTAHREYAKVGLENRNSKKGGWNLFSLSREKKKIRAQVGDVLIKPRGSGKKPGTEDEVLKYGASHGDVVWNISGDKAYLAGGNLGQTNKVDIEVKLNSDGSYLKNTEEYIVVLKRI